jgi:hypothetical protein
VRSINDEHRIRPTASIEKGETESRKGQQTESKTPESKKPEPFNGIHSPGI